MTEELKGLIEKIQQEGIQAAEEKAKAIEDQARRAADRAVEEAGKEAEKIIADAKGKALLMEEGGKAALKQAGRDFLISLRKEIAAMLDRVVTAHVHKALTAEELAVLITDLVKDSRLDAKKGIIISLRKEDLEKLEKGLFNELRGEIKKGVTLKASDEIEGGFLISYDSGRSYYDFTDKALAHYISLQLKPKLAGILNGSVS
jgi:vacuolar-type H+-ATPase subunit E/Vma4